MVSRIISNTPVWVWALLIALLALGFSQIRDRHIGLRRALVVPLVMTALSAAGTVSSLGPTPAVLLAWISATGIAVLLVVRRPLPALTRFEPGTGLCHLPGSWLPMALIMAIFAIKYAVGVSLAVQPALSTSTWFSIAIAVLYGTGGGIFLGSAVRLWMLAHQPDRVSVARAK